MFLKKNWISETKTLSFRLSLSYAVAFMLLLLVALAIAVASSYGALNQRMDEDLEEDALEFQAVFQQHGLPRIIEEVDGEVESGEHSIVFFRILGRDQMPVYESPLEDWIGVESFYVNPQAQEAEGVEWIWTTHTFPDHEYPTRMLIFPLGDGLIMQMGESLEEQYEFMELIVSIFAVMALVLVPIAFLAGWWVTKRSVAGLNSVTQAAVALGQGDLEQQVKVEDQSLEVQQLADTFNTMSQRIRCLISEMREMTDNIAHDLRSPIGRIRVLAEESLSRESLSQQNQDTAVSTLQECDRLIHMIDTTLAVAEVEAGISNSKMKVFDLSSMVNESCDLFASVAEQKNIAIHCSVPDQCMVKGDESAIQRMFANLLDNAIKYTPTGGKVDVILQRAQDHFSLQVADTGMGISMDEQSKIFDRFYRCDQSRNEDGCGLGLSFSSAVARSHGGDILLKSTLNKGSIFIVNMPLFNQRSNPLSNQLVMS